MDTSKTPAKLKENCTNQFEQAIKLMHVPNSIGLSLSSLIHNEHLASRVILEKLNSLSDLECSWQALPSVEFNPSATALLIR
jgi:hypothetical protein